VDYKVLFALEAQDQLASIEDYIAEAENSPAIAARFVDTIICYGESLTDFPLRGLRRDDLMPGLRITNSEGELVSPFLWMKLIAQFSSSVSSTKDKVMEAIG